MSLSFYYTPKVCTTGSKIYAWASSIFFLKKMDWANKEVSMTRAGSEIEIPTRYLV